MKRFEELTREEQNEIEALFSNWLKRYTHEVILKVMQRSEEIINNEFAMNLLKELKEREEKEFEQFTFSIKSLFHDYETYKEYDPHNHPLEHAGSYRNVLYDMYIR
jgi:hypothetical protein